MNLHRSSRSGNTSVDTKLHIIILAEISSIIYCIYLDLRNFRILLYKLTVRVNTISFIVLRLALAVALRFIRFALLMFTARITWIKFNLFSINPHIPAGATYRMITIRAQSKKIWLTSCCFKHSNCDTDCSN